MIVFMVFSNRRRKKAAEDLQSSIGVGATVMLTSGIYGKVVAQDGDRLVIESTPGTKLTVTKLAVRNVDASAPVAKPAAAKPAAAKAAVAKPAAKKPATAKKPAVKKTTK